MECVKNKRTGHIALCKSAVAACVSERWGEPCVGNVKEIGITGALETNITLPFQNSLLAFGVSDVQVKKQN